MFSYLAENLCSSCFFGSVLSFSMIIYVGLLTVKYHFYYSLELEYHDILQIIPSEWILLLEELAIILLSFAYLIYSFDYTLLSNTSLLFLICSHLIYAIHILFNKLYNTLQIITLSALLLSSLILYIENYDESNDIYLSYLISQNIITFFIGIICYKLFLNIIIAIYLKFIQFKKLLTQYSLILLFAWVAIWSIIMIHINYHLSIYSESSIIHKYSIGFYIALSISTYGSVSNHYHHIH